jgi:hypothetical protein
MKSANISPVATNKPTLTCTTERPIIRLAWLKHMLAAAGAMWQAVANARGLTGFAANLAARAP